MLFLGSLLGPLVYFICINDLTLMTRSKIKLFADDTTSYIEFDNPDEATEIVNDNSEKIQ